MLVIDVDPLGPINQHRPKVCCRKAPVTLDFSSMCGRAATELRFPRRLYKIFYILFVIKRKGHIIYYVSVSIGQHNIFTIFVCKMNVRVLNPLMMKRTLYAIALQSKRSEHATSRSQRLPTKLNFTRGCTQTQPLYQSVIPTSSDWCRLLGNPAKHIRA